MKKMIFTIFLLVLLVGAQFPTYPVQAASSQLYLPVTVRPVGGAITILSGGLKGVTGGVGLEPTDWGDYYRVWLEFNIHQQDPLTYAADGKITARVYNPTYGWKQLWFTARCVSFAEEGGKPAATFIAVIDRRVGWNDVWGAGEPGEYLKWQVVDGGTPGSAGDEWRIQYYDFNNWLEYWPVFPEGGCSSFVNDWPEPIQYGNLTIHY